MDDETGALRALLRLRRLRESQAERALGEARGRADAAERELDRRRRALGEYRASRDALEQSLFDAFVDSAGDPASLERYRHGMSGVAMRENGLRERAAEAERVRTEAMHGLDAARRHHALAVRDSEKFSLLAHERDEAIRLAASRREEAEQEEFSNTRTRTPAELA